jgi:uncharacterized protein YeeX (DUF496 family)
LNIFTTKKKNILNQIKLRPDTVVSVPTNLRQLYKKDFLYKEYKEINKKIKKLRSEIDILYIKETAQLTKERDKIKKQIKLLSESKPKKKIKRKKNPRPRGGSRRSSQLKPANVKGSFQLLRTINSKPTPINRLAARVTGFPSKKK